MPNLSNKNYVGYETRRFQDETSEYSIREIMKNFLDYVEDSDDKFMPKEKIKVVIGDFLSENDIGPINVVAEDELLLLDKWNKSMEAWNE